MRTDNIVGGSLKDFKVILRQPFADSTNVNMSNCNETSKEKVVSMKTRLNKSKENKPREQANEKPSAKNHPQKKTVGNKQTNVKSEESNDIKKTTFLMNDFGNKNRLKNELHNSGKAKNSVEDIKQIAHGLGVEKANILISKENINSSSQNYQENVLRIKELSNNKNKKELKVKNSTKTTEVEGKPVNKDKRECKKNLFVNLKRISVSKENEHLDETPEGDAEILSTQKCNKILVVDLINITPKKTNRKNKEAHKSLRKDDTDTSSKDQGKTKNLVVHLANVSPNYINTKDKEAHGTIYTGISSMLQMEDKISSHNMSSCTKATDLSKTTSSNKPLVQNITSRESVPLVKRLRKGINKHYIEESFEDSTLINQTGQNASIVSKNKVPVYKQLVPVLQKPVKDPYEFDVVDTDQDKPRKKKNLNDSGKFNKTMHSFLQKIERKEKKRVKKKPKPVASYDENIQNVLKRVMKKVTEQKSPPLMPNHETNPKMKPVVMKRIQILQEVIISPNSAEIDNSKAESVVQKTVSGSTINFVNISDDFEDGFRGFDNSISQGRESFIEDGFRGFDRSQIHVLNSNSLKDEYFASLNNSSIAQLSEKSLLRENAFRKMMLSSTVPHTSFTSTINQPQNTVGDRNVTSLDANPLDNTRNLHREFHDHISMMADGSCHDTCNNTDFEHSWSDDSEEEDDQYFGFQEVSETTPEKPVRLSNRRKQQPWRLPAIFKRNPYLLKIKQNGLPCGQQEMVIDYEFAKRIEALSANKRPEPAPKPPVQTTMLDFIDSTNEHLERPSEPSLFDYEEFNIVKPRRVLGVLQEHQISTPKKDVGTVLASPNLSVISKPQNIPISTPKRDEQPIMASPNMSIIDKENAEEKVPVRPLQRSYRRLILAKKLQNKSDEDESPKNKNDHGLGNALPSILDNSYEEIPDADIHLFEDVEQDNGVDFSIELPIMKYASNKRKKQVCEGFDADEDKIAKKKKRNMMTKTEEAEFNAWAAKTNARFAEEDKHELTIE
ncbi:uncharacterized protein LOC114334596 [Diabrotica virgifera virgifera]|uniref:Uncharacterized protein LOC114334596 n=1 Tax=Diabrotica virgifera virgifera TaxID=50390 RepID=A0A6P7FVS3_DIAVI|nr:uncharacterized protein LOC114334596 [Diabrotica virgifera virgifera]